MSKRPSASKKTKDRDTTDYHKWRYGSALVNDVSRCRMLKPSKLVSMFETYSKIVVELCFGTLILPNTRFGRRYLRAHLHDILAQRDHGRTIFLSSAKTEDEKEFKSLPDKDRQRWSPLVKPSYGFRMLHLIKVLKKLDTDEHVDPSEVVDLKIARVLYEDGVLEFLRVTDGYLELIEENIAARVAGDVYKLELTDRKLRAIETMVGATRDKLWFVITHVKCFFAEVVKIQQIVTAAYTRLLIKVSNRFKGVTTLEDNFSAGALGLIDATRYYELSEQAAFATYSQWWIRRYILSGQKKLAIIDVPHTVWYALGQVEKDAVKNGGVSKKFSQKYINKLRARVNLTKTVSLDAPLEGDGGDDSMTIGESLRHLDEGEVASLSTRLSDDKVVDEQENSLRHDAILRALKSIGETDIFCVVAWMLNQGIDVNLIPSLFRDLLRKEDIDEEIARQREAAKAVGAKSSSTALRLVRPSAT